MNGRPFALAVLLAAAGGAFAQSAVYRCGNEYTRTPCSQGTVIDTQNSARTAAQRSEALRVAAAERKLADDMERDRRRAEAIRPTPAVSVGPAKPAPPPAKASAAGKSKKKKGNAANEDFVAVVPKAKA